MASLKEIHAQSYSDMPFEQFAQRYHAKFYSDMPFEQFAQKAGVVSGSPAGFATRQQRGEDQITQSEALKSAVAQGASGGLGDELSAAAVAAPGVLGDSERRKRDVTERASAQLGISLPTVPSPLAAIAGGARMLAEKVAPGVFGQQGTQTYEADLSKTRQDILAGQQQYPGTTLAGNIIGGMALPAPAASTVRGMAAGGAGMGALYGFGTGEGAVDRLAQGATGAAIGGTAGAVLGKLVNRTQASPAAPNAVVQASENLGVAVPRAVASDSAIVQRVGQGVRNVPFAGERMVQAVGQVGDDLTRVADDLSANLGSGDVVRAGETAAASIRDWVTGKSKQAVTAAYDQVDSLVNPNTLTPLSATQSKVADILAARQASRISDPGPAVNFVAEAVQDAGGLTYEGIKGLRTRIGEMLKTPSMLPAGTSQAELKLIYGGLTDDLKAAVSNAGGNPALMAFELANRLNQAVQQRRTELAKLVGQNADASPEKVFDAIVARASSSSRGDVGLLAKARQTLGQDWDEVGSAVIARLGRDADGNLTPDRFLTAYAKLSDSGKNVLFDSTTRKALDDIATISSRMRDVGRKFGNPSGTAQNLGFGAAGAGVITAPLTTIGTIVGGNILARILAQPATASSMAKWSRAYELAVTKPTAATASSLMIASRNLASTVSEKLNVQLTAEQILKGIAGPRVSNGEPQQEKQN